MRKILKIDLLIIILVLCFCYNSSEISKSNNEIIVVNKLSATTSYNTNFDKALSDLYTRFPETYGNREVKCIRNLYDMNDNVYKLVEFNPSGYTIYNDDYSRMLETSSEAQSPYINYTDKLIYLGAFNYYHYENDMNSKIKDKEIKHCLDDFSINLNNNSLYELKRISNKLKNNVKNSLKKLRPNITNNYGASILRSNSENIEIAEISQTKIIKDADTTDFNSNGAERCGYVAGALILFYAARAWGWNYLYKHDKIGNDLVNELQGNRIGSSWALELENALNDYINEKGAKHNAKVNMWHIPSAHAIYDRVKEDKPAILFCKVPNIGEDNKVNHAVVVYKVSRNYKTHLFGIKTYYNYVYTAHWGHDEEKNEVYISHDAITIGGLVNLHK